MLKIVLVLEDWNEVYVMCQFLKRLCGILKKDTLGVIMMMPGKLRQTITNNRGHLATGEELTTILHREVPAEKPVRVL